MTSSDDKCIVFVAGCMLCPAFQVGNSPKNKAWSKEILPFFLERNIGIISMPCPESSFGGYEYGMARRPHGIGYYEKVPGFIDYCEELGVEVVNQVEELRNAGFRILAVVGIERSPTCAASFLRTNKGTEKRQGIFISVLKKQMEKREIIIPIIGINRNSCYRTFFKQINQILDEVL